MLNHDEIYQLPDRMADPAKERQLFQYHHFRLAGVRLLVLTMLGCLLGLLFSPAPTLHAQSMDAGLVGYWPFDEGSGTTSADRSGNGNTATLSAGASFTTGSAPIGLNNPSALTFQDADEATATSNGLDNLQQLTIAAWVRLADLDGVQRFVTLGDENVVLRYDSGLHFYVKLNGHLVGERLDELDVTVTQGDYHHVAGTYDGDMLRVYLDGNMVGSEVISGTLESGSGLRFSSSAEPLHGELDEVRIYNRALTSSAIQGLAFNCAAVTEIPQAECQALVALYASTNGDQWSDNSGWLRDNTPCDWSGLSCSYSSIYGLYLYENRLSGALPPELGKLIHLRALWLGYNRLSGAIPPELGNLTNLQELDLNYNQLSGAIPPELGNLINLQKLDLNYNQLSEVIPPELGNLINLQYLALYNNQLSGTIPLELGNLTKAQKLYLHNNQLSGTIPPELGKLANAQQLDLHNNQLSGAIPPELGKLTNLQYLSLYNNQLSGTIPPELGKLTNLQFLRLNNNQLGGTIPATLCRVPLAWGADWGYNKLLVSDSCFTEKDSDWMATQTVPPTAIQAQPLNKKQIHLSWIPITYTANFGYYTVLGALTSGGPYTELAHTADKTATGITLAPLSPDPHYLVVRSFTPKHDDQQNDLTSDDSHEVVVVINTLPVAADATLTVTHGSTLPIHLHANDEDADALNYSLMSLPVHGGVSGSAPDLLYIPAPGFTGEDSFTFKVNDGKTDSNLATITLHVVATPPVNTPPMAYDQSLTTTQATAIYVMLTATDGEPDPLSYQVLTPPEHGVLGGALPALIYTPTTGYTGTDSFTFQVSDGQLNSAPATVQIYVIAQPNRPPVAQDDAFTVTHNSQATVLTVLTNDQDADGDVLRLLAVDPPLNGTAQLINNQLLYTPAPDFVGMDRLTYTVSDDKSSSVATVSVTVSAPVEVTTRQAIYLPLVQR